MLPNEPEIGNVDWVVRPSVLMTIGQAFRDNYSVFFYIALVYGIVSSLLLTVLIIQMWKIRSNDYFVIKGSIYLCICTVVRIGSCFYLFIVYKLFSTGQINIDHFQAFGIVQTQFTFEIPIYLLLVTFYSLLFSTYKLYLVLQEMLGLTQSAADLLSQQASEQ